MANILILNIDSKIDNLALKTIEKYHIDCGDIVQWDMPLMASWADKIYVSCVFEWNRDQCLEWEGRALIGGSGYDLSSTLPLEMAGTKPRINLGFTTRGCIRKCGFCIVPQKEGKLRIVGDLMDLWDGKSDLITLLDNNVLGKPKHFIRMCHQAQQHDLTLDWNQGLDHRLLTDEIAIEMKKTKEKGWRRFAFDHPSNIDTVKRAMDILKRHKLGAAKWYVLVGYNTNWDEDLFRLNYLRDHNHAAYVQRFNNKDKSLYPLALWASTPRWFFAVSFETWMHNKPKKFREKYPEIMEAIT
jgi:hypothetical protein